MLVILVLVIKCFWSRLKPLMWMVLFLTSDIIVMLLGGQYTSRHNAKKRVVMCVVVQCDAMPMDGSAV